MLFHPTKNPVEIKIWHLNKNQKHYQKTLKEFISHGDNKLSIRAFNDITSKLSELIVYARDEAGLKPKNESDDTSNSSLSDSHLENDNASDAKKVFVLDFNGDIKASAVDNLREEISAILSVANKDDEVVVRLESPGGQVHGYGLAAAQLARFKEAGVRVTICVDKVAASGGYMMACVADKIIAAPFSIIGSIGVVAQLPNFYHFLKNHNIDYEVFTAGEYKRTMTVFGENDDEDRSKYQEEIDRIHVLFKDFVHQYRPCLDINKVATGEHWFGTDALALNLVDEINTSDAYIQSLLPEHDVYVLHLRHKPSIAERLGLAEASANIAQAVAEKIPVLLSKLSEH